MNHEPIRVTVHEGALSITLEREGKSLELSVMAFYARQFVIAHFAKGGHFSEILNDEQRHFVSLAASRLPFLGTIAALMESDPFDLSFYTSFLGIAAHIVAMRWGDESWHIHFARRVVQHSQISGLAARAIWEHILLPAPDGFPPFKIQIDEGSHDFSPARTERVYVYHWQRAEKEQKPNPNEYDKDKPYTWFLAPVGIVYIDPKEGESLNSTLDQAWKATEHDSCAPYHWPSRKGVLCLTDKPRSNMPGDVYWYRGEFYMVDWLGFARLVCTFPGYITSPSPSHALDKSRVEPRAYSE